MEPRWPIKGANALLGHFRPQFRVIHSLFISRNGESTQDLLQVRQGAAEEIQKVERHAIGFLIRSQTKETRGIPPRNIALLRFSFIC